MLIERLLDQEVKYLSGGELQRVALVMALGKPADLYLIDEPSAYLDSEQRIAAAKVTFRRDPENFRPRINKADSVKDVEQKQSGNYFFMDE
eukprot:scaffold258260_cov35-Tisochrysis_lutea.AAC.1